MRASSTETQKFDYHREQYIVVFATMMTSCMLNSSNARAATATLADYRLAAADDKFADTWQFAVAFRMRPPRRQTPKAPRRGDERSEESISSGAPSPFFWIRCLRDCCGIGNFLATSQVGLITQ